MKEIRHPVIKLVFIAFFFVFSLILIETIPRLFELDFDPRLEKGIVAMGGPMPEIKPPNPFIRLVVKSLSSILHPPQITLGVDPPPPLYSKATLHQKYFQVIAARQTSVSSVDPRQTNFTAAIKNRVVWTNNPLVYGKFQASCPRMKFLGDVDLIYAQLKADRNALAIVPLGRTGPDLKPLSPPFIVSYWVGWQENKRWNVLGINHQALTTVETLISHAQREYRTRVMDVLVSADKIQLGPHADASILNLAHPKYLKRGPQQLAELLLDLRHRSVKTVGGGFDHIEAGKPAVIEAANGLKVGIASYSQIIPKGGLPTAQQAGINFYTSKKRDDDLDKLSRNTDIQFVLITWHNESGPKSLTNERETAEHAILKGADLVIGFSSQGQPTTEWFKGKFIVFNMGTGGEGKQPLLKATFFGPNLLQAEIH